MAAPISSLSLCLLLYASLLLLADVEGNEITKNSFHTLQITSLPPSNVCNHSSKVVKGGSSLKVVHKHGPCNVDHKASTAPSVSETLRRDKVRVDSIIHARRSLNSHHVVASKDTKTRVRFAGESKTSASDYIVTVGFGTPKKEFPLIFDTGSGFIWTQCNPCNPCYPKPIPVFDPTKSTSFRQDSCSSPTCKFILANGGNCSSSKCTFGATYADQTFTGLYLATETLTIKPSNAIFKNMYFGCGYQMGVNDSNGESGILGLDRYPLSFPSQNADKFKGYFSYCIPSSPSSTGYLTFGGKESKNVKFSPISKPALGSEFYDIQMTGISIGGQKILINASLFKIPRVTIDSGTVITRFSNRAYSVLRSVFRGMMKDYPLIEGNETLDTCYDFSNYTTVTVPSITVFFEGGVEVNIDVSGIMVDVGSNLYCLGFGVYGDDDKSAIFGNAQQKTYTVVFDDANKRVGFGPAGCD